MLRIYFPFNFCYSSYESIELRDNEKSFYFGKGVSKAIDNVNTIIGPALLGKDPRNQSELDKLMKDDLDGTENKVVFLSIPHSSSIPQLVSKSHFPCRKNLVGMLS